MIDTDAYGPLPEWATGLATSHTDIGAMLPTRDGRRIGNARMEQQIDTNLWLVRADAGNELRLNEREIAELFYPLRQKRATEAAKGAT